MAATIIRRMLQKSSAFSALTRAPCGIQCISAHFSSMKIREDKPKRSLTSYMLYQKSVYRDLVNQYPEKSMVEISAVVAETWRNLDETEKQVFVDQSLVDREQYRKEYNEWWDSLTEEEQKEEQQRKREEKNKRMVDRENRKYKQLCREYNKPKHALNDFALFATERVKDFPSLKETLKECRFLWPALTDAEKQVYTDKAKQLREEAEEALLAWEKDMISKNLQQLVRKKTLVDLGLAKKHTLKADKK